MRKFVTLLAGLVSFGAGHAAIIELDGSDSENGVELWLDAGTYDINFLEGDMLAWNAWGRTKECADDGTGCSKGWLTNFNVFSDELGTLKLGRNGKYQTAELAWANAASETFSLSTAQSVRFFIGDINYSKNLGGVTLQVASEAVPVPAAGLIFLSGLLGLQALRAHRQV